MGLQRVGVRLGGESSGDLCQPAARSLQSGGGTHAWGRVHRTLSIQCQMPDDETGDSTSGVPPCFRCSPWRSYRLLASVAVRSNPSRKTTPSGEGCEATVPPALSVEPARWPDELSLEWRVEIGEGYATPLVVGDVVYAFVGREGREVLVALEASTGDELWQSGYPHPSNQVSPPPSTGLGPRRLPSTGTASCSRWASAESWRRSPPLAGNCSADRRTREATIFWGGFVADRRRGHRHSASGQLRTADSLRCRNGRHRVTVGAGGSSHPRSWPT